MALTIRERVLADVFTTLQAIATGGTIPALTIAQVERNRRDPVTSFPAIVLRDGGHERADEDVTYAARRLMRLDVEIYVKSTQPGTDLNALYGAVYNALRADFSRGGIAIDTRETDFTDPLFDTSDADAIYAHAAIGWQVEFWQGEKDATLVAPI